MSSLQTLYRLVVMAGTAVVGGMAWQLYGPPPEQLRPLWDRAREAAIEYWNGAPPEQLADGAPEPFEPSTEGLTPLAAGPTSTPPTHVDRQIAPVAAWSESAPPSVPSAPELTGPGAESSVAANPVASGEATVAAVVERLKALGVADYSLSTWGTSSGLYRFRCAAPWGSNGMYHRHFEAVSANPGEAAQRVLEDVSAWQTRQANASATQIR
jgi:hypothetical protein